MQTLSTHVAVELGKFLEARFGVPSWTGFLLDRATAKASFSLSGLVLAPSAPCRCYGYSGGWLDMMTPTRVM